MKKLLLAFALFFISSPAWAQCSGVFPNGTYCGNNSGSTNVPTALPLPTINSIPLSNNQMLIGGVDNVAHGQTISGDCTTTITGVITCGKLQNIGVTTSGASTNEVMYFNGTGWIHNAILTVFNAACVASPSTCVGIFGYANPIWWGASSGGSAATNTTAFTSAFAASNYVLLPSSSTFAVSAAVKLSSNQRLNCNGSTITQNAATNLSVLIDAFTNVPNNSQIDHCVLDGNQANNTTGITIIDFVGVNRFNITWNTVKNFGLAMNIGNDSNGIIEHNYVDNTNAGIAGNGISVFNTAAGSQGNHQVRFNTVVGAMTHMLFVQLVDANDISFNWLLGTLALGGNNSAMQVSISGTAVTWVSGTNFAGVVPGEFIVVNSGTECTISTVNSTTSLTLSSSCGVLNNVPAAIGGGDNLAIYGTSFNRIIGNHVFGGVTGGLVVSTVGGATPRSAVSNIISNNFVYDSGNFSIALESATTAGNPVINDTIVASNYVYNPGRSGSAGVLPAGIQLSADPSTMSGILIDDNFLNDSFGVTGGFWLTASGLPNATNVMLGMNFPIGFANGSATSGYPTFASLPAVTGYTTWIIDGAAGNCGDGTCTTWGTTVTGGGGGLKLGVMYNGTGWHLSSK